jgi:hypothetical protein
MHLGRTRTGSPCCGLPIEPETSRKRRLLQDQHGLVFGSLSGSNGVIGPHADRRVRKVTEYRRLSTAGMLCSHSTRAEPRRR